MFGKVIVFGLFEMIQKKKEEVRIASSGSGSVFDMCLHNKYELCAQIKATNPSASILSFFLRKPSFLWEIFT